MASFDDHQIIALFAEMRDSPPLISPLSLRRKTAPTRRMRFHRPNQPPHVQMQEQVPNRRHLAVTVSPQTSQDGSWFQQSAFQDRIHFHRRPVAQLVERRTNLREVASSTQVGPTLRVKKSSVK